MNKPMEMFKDMMGFSSPKQMVMDMARENMNPMFNNLIQMAEKNDTQGLENFAKNLYKQKGKDFDKEFGAFKKELEKYGVNYNK